MSSNSRVLLIYRNRGCDIPDAYLEKAVKEYGSWSGYSFVINGEINSDSSAGGASVNGIKTLCAHEDIKDVDILFALGKEETPVGGGCPNFQPFEAITDNAGNVNVLVFVDGELASFKDNKATEGRPYLFFNQRLRPMINSVWSMAGGDAAKFADFMALPHNESGIIADVGKEGCVCIFTSTPDKPFMAYLDGDNFPTYDEYPWGFTNNTLGYKESEAIVQKPDDKQKDTTVANFHVFRVGAAVLVNQDVRKLYEEYHGKPVGNWKQRPAVTIHPDKLEKALKDTRLTVSVLAGVVPTQATKPATKAAQEISSDVTKEKIKKFVDANVLEVMSPEQMAANEKARPTIWEETGWKYEDFIIATNLGKVIDFFKKEHPEKINQIVHDLCHIIFQQQKDLAALTEPEKKTEPASVPQTGKKRYSMSG
jgi:hypothetical protein